MKNSGIIKKLLNAKEGEHIQFKEAKARFDKNEAARCCCALANCGGGQLILGISDKRPRKVVGSDAFQQPERTMEFLMDKLKVMVDFQVIEYQLKRVLIFYVSSRPNGMPVQYNGMAMWYQGDRLIPMPEDVRRRIYWEGEMDFSGSICKDATLDDLDKTAIENFCAKWMEKSRDRRLQTESSEQLLRDCGAITDEGITYAALILFGKQISLRKYLPPAEIVFEYRTSEAAGPAAQREEFNVGFFACYNRIWELINLRNNKQYYQIGLFVFDIDTFNEMVIREAILNAVCHRNYQMSSNIFIRQYSDRIVVESPGGLPYGITLDNIINRQSPRNRRIAEILARCGLVERSGQGMNLMYELSIKEAKQLPDFNGTDDYGVCITLNGLVLDVNMLVAIKKIGNKQLETFSTSDFLVIDALHHNKKLPKNLLGRLKRLEDLGIVEHIGRSKYILASRLYEAAGKSGVYTRVAGLDRETNKELLLKHIRNTKAKGAPLKELQQVLPSLSEYNIKILINELREENKIFKVGNTKGTHWVHRSFDLKT